MFSHYFHARAVNAKAAWQSVVWSALPALIWTNLSIFAVTLLLYISGLCFGDANPFSIDYFWHAEWTLVGMMAAFGIHAGKRIASKRSASPIWPLILGVIAACTLGGMLIDLCYQLIAPLFGVQFAMNIMYYDIRFESTSVL